jgi:ABC transporter DrrB family efflux protein
LRNELQVTTRRHEKPLVIKGVLDALAMTQRNLITIRRVPQLLVFTFIQPVIFVLMFRYVFGGAIQVPNESYVDYLMPGVFVQTVTFGAISSAVGIATDVQSGLLERFRSLPMSRAAVLAGRTTADLIRSTFVVALMLVVGYLVGFRVHTSVGEFLAGMALIVLFCYVLSWVFVTIGLAVREPESAQAAAFPIMAPLVFASSAFVPVASMPSWLQPFANHQPVSVTASAVRALMLGGPVQSDLLQSLLWSALIIAVCAPLAVWMYRRAA